MEIAPITPEASVATVRHDRDRVRYALFGALTLVIGVWIVWLAAFALGWDMDMLGIRPRDPAGLAGIFTAPFVHASFEHLMSNTLPLGLLSAFALYAYPRAMRYALPLIWIFSGLGVWLFARPTLHVGISGITHGLMFFLFLTGLFRRDRLGVSIALAVFFLYGGMALTVLPREENVSFEYHLAGAIAGVISAIAFSHLDPLPPRKRYSWEDENDESVSLDDDRGLERGNLEPPSAENAPMLRQDPRRSGNVIEFPHNRR